MMFSKPPVNSRGPVLADVLHSLNMKVARLSIYVVGISLFLVGLLSLRYYVLNNLGLSSRAIAYSVEAAVIFNDREAATEALSLMSANHPISSAYVLDRSGDELARWVESGDGFRVRVENMLANVLLPTPVVAPIHSNGQYVGTVKIFGSGRDLLSFLVISFACGLASLILCSIVASRLSRRASLAIMGPLGRLASVTAKARKDRQFQHRVNLVGIAELQDLGEDFNALLAELERWQAQVASNTELLTYQANHDPLTGLSNRAHFEAMLASHIQEAGARRESIALFFIDADCFKSINDELGHDVGDAVLCAIAQRLSSNVRETDLVVRLGGDEFAILLAPLNDVSQARRIADKILESMKEPICLPSGNTLMTSLSVGVALYPKHAVNAPDLVKKADEAMYQSKHAGRGVYSIASEEIARFSKEKL